MTATLDILTTTTTDDSDGLQECPWSDPDTTVTPEIAKLAALLAQSYTGGVLFA
jgi:hypothetical protein